MNKATREKYAGTEGFQFDADTHSYFYDGKPMTGVTTILGVLAKPALIGWAARMATEYVLGQKTRLEADFNELEAILEEARVAHAKKRDDAADRGTGLHELVELWVLRCLQDYGGQPIAELPEPSQAIQPFVFWAQKNGIKFLDTEAQLYSKELFVAGTADLIFEKDGKTYIGDVKTYNKIWDRVPFYQCAGYGLMWQETHAKPIDGYCILRLGKDGSFEEKWSWDVEGDTKAFLACVEIYRQNQNFK